MKNSKLALWGLRNGAGALAYIALVVVGLMSTEKRVVRPSMMFLVPMVMLTLFVLSALIEGALVLGQPILMYSRGEKADALKLLGFTAGTMAVALVIILFVLVM